jgi:hypothetical protein
MTLNELTNEDVLQAVREEAREKTWKKRNKMRTKSLPGRLCALVRKQRRKAQK